MNFSKLIQQVKTLGSNPVIWVLSVGLALRIYSAAMRCIINPDGAQYIYQASAIFNCNWSQLLNCKLSYISPFPFFIAAAFGLVHDWVAAGQVVNVLFGWAVLIPLYFILIRFADRTVSTLTVLIYALIPTFVEGSGDVMRDPMFWFLICMGMLMFVRHGDDNVGPARYRFDLTLSSIFFICATWARIEGILFIAITPVFLIFSRIDRKIEKCLVFISPLLLLSLGAYIAFSISGRSMDATIRLDRVFTEVNHFFNNYRILGIKLAQTSLHQGKLFEEFLRRLREILPFIPLVSVFYNILEGVFYPFALICFLGVSGLVPRCRQERLFNYFILLSGAGLVVLYIHIANTWVMAYRFLAILLFPSCLIMSNGIKKTITLLQTKYQWQTKTIVWALAAFFMLTAIPKNLKPEERDKVVYRQVASLVSQNSIKERPYSLAAVRVSRGFEWIFLYSQRDRPSLPCAKSQILPMADNYDQFVRDFDEAGLIFLFYEQRTWPNKKFDFLASTYTEDFKVLGHWVHSDSGQIILLKRKI